MYDPKLTFLESELQYRTDRLKSGLAKGNRRHLRIPRARRSAETVRNAR
jgi:hypothetical protein